MSEATFRRTGSWIECQLEHGTPRLGGDEAAVHWPSLRLVELGKYAESLRRGLDAQLPWMPHRTNEELARWFDVKHEAGEVNDDGTWLRLVPIGLPRDGSSYLQIAYSNDSGEPIAWESYEAGNRVARIDFDERADSQADTSGRTAVLRDADGKERIRWELTDIDGVHRKAEPDENGVDVADLIFGWDDCLVLDYRAEQPVIDAPLADALTAIRQFDWTGTVGQLRRLSADRGTHPLACFLEAWCLENVPAQLYWQVQQSGRLDDGRLATALRIWNQAGHAARVIDVCEQRLRTGDRLPDGVAEPLAAAYRAENRPRDARRAASHR